MPIAVVGMGGVFPGALDLAAFKQNVMANVDTTREVPEGRWVIDRDKVYAHADERASDKLYSTRGCFVDEFTIDPAGLRIDSELLEGLDPLYRLVLQAGRAAWSAGKTARLDPARVGVVLAAIALPTDASSTLTRDVLGRSFERALLGTRAGRGGVALTRPEAWNSRVTALPAALLATALGLGGGSYTLDAACASSLYALHLACEELRARRADAMLAGGVSRPECLYTQMGFSQLRALSPTGCCRPFDAAADGLIVGEGAGLVLLKRLDDALRDGDHIHAIIRSIGWSNDIAGSLLAADSEGQLRAMRAAYEKAGWQPEDVDLIECHGTGTPVGDAAEIHSLRTLWEGSPWRTRQCVIGSVKSMIGHLLTGAGIAGLIKTILALEAKRLPPTANFERPALDSKLDGGPFRVISESEPWPRRSADTLRRAAVSAFGFGGINGHLLLEEWDSALCEADGGSLGPVAHARGSDRGCESVPIAIVGMETRFGRLGSLREFQEAVLSGASAIGPRPADRWWGCDELAGEILAGRSLPGAYLERLSIEIGRFRLPPAEIPEVLPQQLLMLQVVDRALIDAGVLSRERRPRAGVMIGIGLDLNTSNFHHRWVLADRAREWSDQLGLELSSAELADWVEALRTAAGPALNAGRVQGALGGMIASRIAREYSFGGPSFAVSAEEASGIRALEIAVRTLQRREIDLAVAGAVDLAGDVRNVLARHTLRPYSRGPEVRPFDATADGTVVGEGAVALVLKRLPDALADGDRVYAVVRGIGTAGGMVEGGVSPEVYRTALERAYGDTDVDPASISLIEAHGSGDPHEDRVEAAALLEFFTAADSEPCALGSVKPNIGHTGAAAGLASVAKSALCLYQEMLPPLVGYEQNGGADWGAVFHVPAVAGYWLRDRLAGPRRVGVSTMTLDGNCAHVILEGVDHEPEYGVVERRQPLGPRRMAVFAIAGRDVAALLAGLDTLSEFLGGQPGGHIEHLARVWHEQHPCDSSACRALAIVVQSVEQLGMAVSRVRHALENAPGTALDGDDGIHYSPRPLGLTGELAFVFPGSGNHYVGMGMAVGAQWPEILRALDAGTDRLMSQLMPRWYAPWRSSWTAGWEVEATAALQADHLRMMMGQVAHGIVMSDLLRALGVVPRAAIGYSLGETTSLFALRAWRDRDEMFGRMTESPLFRSELAGACDAARRKWGLGSEFAVDWRVAVVNRSARHVRPAVARQVHTYLLIANTPDECVIGGRGAQVRAVIEALGCEAVYLDGAATVHCKIVSEVEAAYRELHLLTTTPPEDVRFYSAAWGRAYELNRVAAADSILAQALHGFDFTAVIEQAYRDGVRVFVEPGPQTSCSRMIDRILESRPHVARSACVRGRDGVETVLNLVAALVTQRVLSDLTPLYGGQTCVAAHRASVFEIEQRARVEVPVGGAVPQPPMPMSTSVVAARDDARGSLVLGDVVDSEGAVAARAEARGSSILPDQEQQFHTCEAVSPSLPAHDGSRSNDLSEHSLGDSVADMVARAGAAEARAHEAFLNFSQQATEAMGGTIAFQTRLIELLGRDGRLGDRPLQGDAGAPVVPSATLVAAEPDVAYSREMCMEFAVGSLARVLGPEFAEVDSYSVRVRLPDEPLMLVDRIMSVTAEKRSLTGGNIVTEHDVRPGAWYLDGGRCPTAIAVEAGQADLFLCSYLGIDLAVKGTRSYRLLDAAVTFQRGLPRPGEVVRYDITIEKFVQQGDVYLFFFSFDGTIDGEPLLTMRDGCAGFFTSQEIKDSGGIVLTPEERAPAEGKLPEDWRELVPMRRESYSEQQIDALRDGDLVGCFGKLFADLPLSDPPRIPGGKMRLVHRVTELDPTGGRYGLGLIRAEADIHADDWFLTCHFVDDMVMPGTLMYECCLHTLRVFLLRMGWVGEHGAVCYEPVPGVTSTLRCRGPVTVDTKVVTYEVHMKEFGYGPEPYVITDAFMYGDGEMIVRFTDMALKITGLSRAKVEEVWDRQLVVEPVGVGVPEPIVKRAIFDNKSILAFAIGKPSLAFGERYAVFDGQRRIARLPGPPYKFLDRITEVHARAWELEPGGWIEGQYDVPPDGWYFRANRQPAMPFSVLLEIALQPCGWLAAYMGSALRSDKDLRFRNLGGTATLYEEVFADAGLLTTRVRLTNVSQAGGMIVQDFDMQVWRDGRIVYDGTTSFGFFSQEALDRQVGIRDADQRLYVPMEEEAARGRSFTLETYAPLTPDDGNQPAGPAAALPGRALRMNDTIELLLVDGGANGLGFVRAVKQVDPDEWFFAAHFHQDPVCPGSLGLEAFLQALKVLALERWGTAVEKAHRFEPILVGAPHTWVYRGQIIPANRRVEVEATVIEIREGATPEMVANGFLKVDGLPIYEMIDFGLRLVPVR